MEAVPTGERAKRIADEAAEHLKYMAAELQRTRADAAAQRMCGVIAHLVKGDWVVTEKFCEFFQDYVLRGDSGDIALRTLVVRYWPGRATHLDWSVAKLNREDIEEHKAAPASTKSNGLFEEVEVGRLLNHFSDLGIHDGSRPAIEITATTEDGEPVL